MVGITLSPEQIRSAPIEVRRWLQQEIAASLGMSGVHEAAGPAAEHLVVCGPEEAAAIFGAIREMPPVVAVFFELGREGEGGGQGQGSVHGIANMMRHAHLQNVEQLDACLQVINQAVRSLRGDPGATLYVLDPRGFCVIAAPSQKAIQQVWLQLASQSIGNVGSRGASDAASPVASAPDMMATPPQGAPPAAAAAYP